MIDAESRMAVSEKGLEKELSVISVAIFLIVIVVAIFLMLTLFGYYKLSL